MGFRNSTTIEGITKLHKLEMKRGSIGNAGGDLFVIDEEFCNSAYEDSLRVYYNDIPIQTVVFSVRAPHKDTLAIIVGDNCSYRTKREKILANPKLFVFPGAAGYTVDSFSITILLKRGDVIGPFKIAGNDFSSFERSFKEGTKIYFENISASSRLHPGKPIRNGEKFIRFE